MSTQVVRSESLRKLLTLAEQVAKHPAAVLIVGETGTGKEMLARSIHKHSLRCNNAWIDVNCAAMPEHLVESELFGYEKGAFSGADGQKPGMFEMAHGGTLFLDEIGDLDPKVQVKMLRVLDGVPYFRLGGSKKVNVDVRIVAATNQNLEELVSAGKFRSDLYHRLAQFKLEVPALRDRPEDLIGIAEQLLHQHWPESHFTGEAIGALLGYDWPGNVRELRNCLFRAVMLAKNPPLEITAADLRLPRVAPPADAEATLVDERDEFERQKVYEALERSGGNQGRAAELLGISRRTLLRKLKVYREARLEPSLGSLCTEQQRYYRVKLNAPAVLDCEEGSLHGTVTNLSVGGAAVSLRSALKFGSEVTIKFQIPGSDEPSELDGRIAWSNSEGDHGIQFRDLKPQVRSTLQRWLQEQMKKEGWHVDCTA
jgi:transcriptional regulator with PAS, ATPase and Fis domain